MTLKILIIGAGLVGLSTAIALAREGHDVEVFEKSRFTSEVGAAFHILPTAFKLLKDEWELDVESMKPVVNSMWRFVDSETLETLRVQYRLAEKLKELGTTDPHVMCFRVDCHNLLKESAASMANIKMNLGDGLASIDSANARITLASGTEHTGDVVVGADGIHSRTLLEIDEASTHTSSLGLNMYRFLVPVSKAKQNPEVAELLNEIGFYDGVGNNIIHAATKHSLVLYPCRGCDIVNGVTFQPADAVKVKLPEDDYNCPSSTEDIKHVLSNWPKKFLALADMAEDVKHWAAVSRDVPPTYIKDKLVLVGDAAHPTMPKHGAGAGMGMEDAASLAALLNRDVKKADIPRRLELYNKLRYPRSVACKFSSEIFKLGWTANPDEAAAELMEKKVPGMALPKDVTAFLFKYDPIKEARDALAAEA